jgi:hypothetical protein
MVVEVFETFEGEGTLRLNTSIVARRVQLASVPGGV